MPRLTKHDRETFVRAVMADVPQIDYNEQASAHVTEHAVGTMHPDVRKVWDNPDLRQFCKTNYCNLPHPLFGCWAPVILLTPPDLQKELSKLAGLAKAQLNMLDTLRAKVSVAITQCSTLKQAQERLPEFVNYLPKDRESTGVKNLPALISPIADLLKAGWPKGCEAKGGEK